MSRILAVAYYQGSDGDTRVKLVRTEDEAHYVDPEGIGLTTDDNINSVQVMYDDCKRLAWIAGNDSDNGAAVMYDVTEAGSEDFQAGGYNIAELEDFTLGDD
jgi:hypothetical protein